MTTSQPVNTDELTVLLPEDTGYQTAASCFSVLVVQRPERVVGATSAAQVSAAVQYAHTHGLCVRVQNTGHGCAEMPDGLLISMRGMAGVSIDAATGTATVQGGARMRELIDAAAAHGLAPRCGSTPDVGVVGFTLGGGVPIAGRTTGYGADAMISADVVLADGREVTVDASNEPELFWALRGGKGPFCIVTAMTLKLDPIDTIFAGALYYAGEHAATLLPAYRDWVATLPEAMTTSIALLRLPPLPDVPEPLRGVLTVAIRIVHVGDPAAGAQLIAPMQAAAPVIFGGVGEMPYGASAIVYNDPEGPLPAITAGALLREFNDADIDALLTVCGPEQNVPVAVLEIRHLGGALGRAPAGIDAVSGRHGAFLLNVVGMLTPELADITPQILGAVQQAVASAAADGGQVNFCVQTPVEQIWGSEVLTRLMAVKAAYDPANVFRGPLNFTPTLPAQR